MSRNVDELEALLEDSARIIQQVKELTERLAETQNLVIETVRGNKDGRERSE